LCRAREQRPLITKTGCSGASAKRGVQQGLKHPAQNLLLYRIAVVGDYQAPAMAAGMSDRLWEVSDIVALWEAVEPKAKKRGSYKKPISD